MELVLKFPQFRLAATVGVEMAIVVATTGRTGHELFHLGPACDIDKEQFASGVACLLRIVGFRWDG